MRAFRLAVLSVWAMLSAFGQDHTTWSDYGGGADSAQYSALKQINRTNVSKLEVACTYPTADGRKYLFNPIVVDGLMYVLAKNNTIIALNAATGEEVEHRSLDYVPGEHIEYRFTHLVRRRPRALPTRRQQLMSPRRSGDPVHHQGLRH